MGYAGTLSLYCYVASRPISLFDPTGLFQRDPNGPEWHHNYPKGDPRLKPYWDEFDIDPHKEECGCLMLGKHHAKIHPDYQNEIYRRIREYIEGPPVRKMTKEKLDEIVKEVQNHKDFRKYFGQARKSCCSYDEWRKKSKGEKRNLWKHAQNADILEEMAERLRRRGTPRAGRALNKLVAAMGILSWLGGISACLAGDCDAEMDNLLDEARRIAPNGGLTPHGLSACVGYFSAWNQLGNCMGLDTDIYTSHAAGLICAEVYAGN